MVDPRRVLESYLKYKKFNTVVTFKFDKVLAAAFEEVCRAKYQATMSECLRILIVEELLNSGVTVDELSGIRYELIRKAEEDARRGVVLL
ncbi:MAG: hypothetical protein QXI60_04980 [Thermofilaceae archaeon]